MNHSKVKAQIVDNEGRIWAEVEDDKIVHSIWQAVDDKVLEDEPTNPIMESFQRKWKMDDLQNKINKLVGLVLEKENEIRDQKNTIDFLYRMCHDSLTEESE